MKKCAVAGCEKPAKTRGWCADHYGRWLRHGDPCAGRVAVGEPERFIREVALPYEGNECLHWPYGRNSDGYAEFKQRHASIFICEQTQGSAPMPKHEAAHTCGKGHLGCINPWHLEWKTHKENDDDKEKHGTRFRGEEHLNSRLTKREVRIIRMLNGVMVQKDIGAIFGITQVMVSRILLGKAWK